MINYPLLNDSVLCNLISETIVYSTYSRGIAGVFNRCSKRVAAKLFSSRANKNYHKPNNTVMPCAFIYHHSTIIILLCTVALCVPEVDIWSWYVVMSVHIHLQTLNPMFAKYCGS